MVKRLPLHRNKYNNQVNMLHALFSDHYCNFTLENHITWCLGKLCLKRTMIFILKLSHVGYVSIQILQWCSIIQPGYFHSILSLFFFFFCFVSPTQLIFQKVQMGKKAEKEKFCLTTLISSLGDKWLSFNTHIHCFLTQNDFEQPSKSSNSSFLSAFWIKLP